MTNFTIADIKKLVLSTYYLSNFSINFLSSDSGKYLCKFYVLMCVYFECPFLLKLKFIRMLILSFKICLSTLITAGLVCFHFHPHIIHVHAI